MADYDCVVIGGGPAGIMAAIAMAQRKLHVLVIERNKLLGRKLRITGKGRCNITNDCEFDDLISSMCRGGKFMYSSFRRFDNRALIDFFNQCGLDTVTERGGRVFPESQKAYDVAETLRRKLSELKVPVLYEAHVIELMTEDNGGAKAVCGVRVIVGGKRRDISARNVIVATGGVSYPDTGSTGDGYKLAASVGHTIVTPKPSLVALICEDRKLCASMQGLSLRNISLRLIISGKTVYKDFGEMIFTDNGISGPTVLSASAHLAYEGVSFDDVEVSIDLKAALDDETLDARINRDFAQSKRRHLVNSLDELLPKRLIMPVIEMSGIEPHTPVDTVSKAQKAALRRIIKDMRFKITGTENFSRAIVTSGGVSLAEVTPSTLASKLCKGLYFAGEVLDIDGYTGGFNLTAAFSTGYNAGCAV